MDDPKVVIAKLVVKGVIGLAISAVIGSLIKSERSIGAVIDEQFANKIK